MWMAAGPVSNAVGGRRRIAFAQIVQIGAKVGRALREPKRLLQTEASPTARAGFEATALPKYHAASINPHQGRQGGT